MAKNIYIGSLSYKTTKEDLEKLFGTIGTVVHAKILLIRETGKSKGVGFVEMATDGEARTAISRLNGTILNERKMFITEAKADDKQPGKFIGGPDYVDRRSGKDRRKSRTTPTARVPRPSGPGGFKKGGPGGFKKTGPGGFKKGGGSGPPKRGGPRR